MAGGTLEETSVPPALASRDVGLPHCSKEGSSCLGVRSQEKGWGAATYASAQEAVKVQHKPVRPSFLLAK